MIGSGLEIWRNGAEYRRQFLALIQPAQDAVARSRVGNVNETPLADIDPMAAMLTDDARVVAIRSVVLRVDRTVEDGPDELAITAVDRGGGRSIANPEGERLVKREPSRQILRNRKVQLGRVLPSLRSGHATALVEVHKLSERFLGIHGQSVEKHGEINRCRLRGGNETRTAT